MIQLIFLAIGIGMLVKGRIMVTARRALSQRRARIVGAAFMALAVLGIPLERWLTNPVLLSLAYPAGGAALTLVAALLAEPVSRREGPAP
jgi:hypothetical protein